MASFNMFFTGVSGGPCPVCGGSGELIHHFGTQGPGGLRIINHEGAPQGQLCTVVEAEGIMIVKDGVWRYEKREETT